MMMMMMMMIMISLSITPPSLWKVQTHDENSMTRKMRLDAEHSDDYEHNNCHYPPSLCKVQTQDENSIDEH